MAQEAKAVASYIRIPARKVRLVVDLIRGKKVGEAIAILRHTPRSASPVLEKLLNSAVANAEHNYQLDVNKLVISEAYVNEGPTLKRFQPRSQGRAFSIFKRSSHITLVVSEK
ncbi:50S ribosomal protein L22 [Cohnella nanjingensis]|uniref:Large ribosomal subunit protein uL22 n=1 Tax=Cohnella nanjingensis TaxID=1387779 RepID=A0A7X0RZ98_9BACL|nr:50S ribosomal protein L22 [Cohnella nanjingensis]MBB6675060.1 50S ribosomal protein L22 [Cohnella nanjingensis]